MSKYYCPDCGGEIIIDEYTIVSGEIVSCPSCGLEFEIKIEIDGLSLNELTLTGDDWGE